MRNGAAVVPFLETFDLKVCATVTVAETIITMINDCIVVVFIVIPVISLFDHCKLTDMFSDIRSIDMKDVQAVRHFHTVIRNKIP